MPKHDFMSPKAISNRIKSKGLQKLRWFCQMCEKQCRDENGFKCHISSEAHQRQLLLVAENPGRYVASFSQQFLRDFMKLLSHSYGTRRVHANEVYQEYIKDKNHYHMNATRWTTLTGFCMFLGKTGMCEVEPTPKGWFIKYIDRSPAVLAREQATAKKSKMDKDDEDRCQKVINEQIARALATKGDIEEPEPVYTELQRKDESEKVVLNLFKSSASPSTSVTATSSSTVGNGVREGEEERGREGEEEGGREEEEEGRREGEEEGEGEDGGSKEDTEEQKEREGRESKRKISEEDVEEGRQENKAGREAGAVKMTETLNDSETAKPKHPLERSHSFQNVLKTAVSLATGVGERGKTKKKVAEKEDSRKRKRSALDEIREMEEQRKEKMNRRENWITEGIVVKVVHKKLYSLQKGVVEGVEDQFTALVRILDTGDKVKFDQAHLETVIPAIGKPVMVVNGAYRGLRAILEGLNTAKFCVSVRIDQGLARGRLVDRVPYEDISKLNVEP